MPRLIAELGRHPLAEGELREVKEGLYVSLNQSQPKGIDYAFCLSSSGRMHFFFMKAAGTARKWRSRTVFLPLLRLPETRSGWRWGGVFLVPVPRLARTYLVQPTGARRQRPNAGLVEDEEPGFRAVGIRSILFSGYPASPSPYLHVLVATANPSRLA
jgi:hypothetical protein